MGKNDFIWLVAIILILAVWLFPIIIAFVTWNFWLILLYIVWWLPASILAGLIGTIAENI